jgi:hypothetical protein
MMLERLQGELRRKILDLRSVDAVVYKTGFRRLFEASTKEQKEEVRKLILEGEREKVAEWLLTHPKVDLGELSGNKLKELGKRLGVINYSRLDRVELAIEIERVRKCAQKKN